MTTKPLSLFHYLPLCRKRQKHQRSTTTCVTISIDNYSFNGLTTFLFHFIFITVCLTTFLCHFIFHTTEDTLHKPWIFFTMTSRHRLYGSSSHLFYVTTSDFFFRYIPTVHRINQRLLLHLLFAKPPYYIMVCVPLTRIHPITVFLLRG
jgi:hypothetical protein